MAVSSGIAKLDLYSILGVEESAAEREIIKAYRQQARKCHPDKNPDNPKAAALFQELSQALAVLTDAAARAAYDKIQKAKKAAEARHRELDSKRKKLKEDLEARENAAFSNKEQDITAKRNLQAEIERLRKEGSKLLENEQELLKEEIKKGRDSPVVADEEKNTPKLKIKWKAKKSDPDNGGYSHELLYSLFQKYGAVLNLLVSRKKNGTAIVEFDTCYAAETAFKNEMGFASNPLTLTWLEGQASASSAKTEAAVHEQSEDVSDYLHHKEPEVSTASTLSHTDYESLVLMKMRQAEERRRLIEQMKEEDEKDT